MAIPYPQPMEEWLPSTPPQTPPDFGALVQLLIQAMGPPRSPEDRLFGSDFMGDLMEVGSTVPIGGMNMKPPGGGRPSLPPQPWFKQPWYDLPLETQRDLGRRISGDPQHFEDFIQEVSRVSGVSGGSTNMNPLSSRMNHTPYADLAAFIRGLLREVSPPDPMHPTMRN